MNSGKSITSLYKLLVRHHLTFFIQFHHISEKIMLKVKGVKGIDKILCIIHEENTVISTQGEI